MKKFIFIFIIFFISNFSFSQSEEDSLNPFDTKDLSQDSVSKSALDTNQISKSDSINSLTLDTSKIAKSGVDAVINYAAKDSLVYDLKANKVFLYNEAKLTYKDLKLDAGRISIDQETQILEAYGIPDTVRSGKFMQSPLMFQGSDKYEGSKLSYNFKTQQGNVSMGFSEAELGYYFGDKIKKVAPDVLFIKNGIYTTSTDREDPEYYFLSPKMKVIPNDKIIAQSVFLYIEGVPVFWLPFGVFPNKSGRSSGLIIPKFGDDAQYGKYLSNLGYFFALNDYTDLALSGSYFSNGRIDAYGRFRYALKYNYSGNINGGYSRIRLGESNDINQQGSDAWGLNITHNQQITPTSRLDATLGFVSNKNYYNVTTNSLSELLLQNVVSNLTYTKNWENTPFSLNVNYYRDQNLQTGNIIEKLPLINFSISQNFPFESKISNSYNKKLYEYFSYSYNGSLLNIYDRGSVKNSAGNDSSYKNFRSGFANTVNLGFSPKFEYITLVPFFNYNEIYYNKYLEKNFNPADSSVTTNELDGIKALRYFRTGVNFSTRFVGIFNPKVFNVTGIRHQITPSFSYVYQPDFSDPKWGYYKSYIDATGREIRYSVFENSGGLFGGPPSGELQSLVFGLGNVFEMKTRTNDTTENKFQLLNLDAGFSYNFAADSLNFSEIGASFRTNIGSILNISGGATFNLYKYDQQSQSRINQFLVDTDGKLANITQFTFSASTSFNFGSTSNPLDRQIDSSLMQDTMTFRGDYVGIQTAKSDEVDFNIPFSGGFGFYYNESRPSPYSAAFISSNLTGNVGFNLTEKWRFTFQSSYDVINKAFTAPYVTAYRDLNSWEMNFNWYPTGTYRGFSLEIRLKAPQLRDIKVSKQTNARGVFN
ncbi:MAG TPA: putative LPS assembly protein LptD [Ignavibacteria bacterium]|nr:putative LPS assembly protein LptD [Ignavibacteria bacterium]